MDNLSQYRELYIQTGKEYVQNLNTALLKLEKKSTDKAAIDEVFRSAHSLKSQSAAMGYQSTGYLCHIIEDVFFEIKNDRLPLSAELADHLFKALDGLDRSLKHIEHKDQEIDLSDEAEMLKQLTGVTTAGMGKTKHNIEQNTPATTPTLDEPPKTIIAAVTVKVEVLDAMMNLLENLLLEQLKLKHANIQVADPTGLRDYIDASEKIIASMQYQVMKARAVPLSLVFNHFPRAVRDLARAENKQVELIITGGDQELDRTIVERLDEPLTHLLRNAVSHGIKDTGTITLSATRQKDYAQISVTNDGRGIDWQEVAKKAGLPAGETNERNLKEALFSGISTSKVVTQISGRGVGLTAIKTMVDSFGGSIDVVSEPGKDTAFIMKLPLTLAIAKVLIVTVNQKYFAIPALAIERLVRIPAALVKKIADQEAFILDGAEVPLVRLEAKLTPQNQHQTTKTTTNKELTIVVVGNIGEKLGLVVDTVRDTANVVIKPVPAILRGVSGFSGVTILDDGQTALIINPQELV